MNVSLKFDLPSIGLSTPLFKSSMVREIDPDEDDFEDAVDQAIEQNKVSIIEKCNEATSRLNVNL